MTRMYVVLGWRLAAWAEAARWFQATTNRRPAPSLDGAQAVRVRWEQSFGHEPGKWPPMCEYDWQWATLMFDRVLKETES